MKLTRVLNRQHIDFMFKKHWLVQGKRVPIDTGVEDVLRKKGIPVEDALEFIKEKPVRERYAVFIFKKYRIYKTEQGFTSKTVWTCTNGVFNSDVALIFRVNIVGPYEPQLPLDETHPDYKTRPCLTLTHKSVLLEGIAQAQVLTKTIIAENKLPNKIEELAEIIVPKAVHEGVKKAILSSNVFDCEQQKLPKIKDPVRPAYNFPRILGITDRRRK